VDETFLALTAAGGLAGVALGLYRLLGLREGGRAWGATRAVSAGLAVGCALGVLGAGGPWLAGVPLLALAAA
jgi:hypothetical protein